MQHLKGRVVSAFDKLSVSLLPQIPLTKWIGPFEE